jgi:hypothetical protein
MDTQEIDDKNLVNSSPDATIIEKKKKSSSKFKINIRKEESQ